MSNNSGFELDIRPLYLYCQDSMCLAHTEISLVWLQVVVDFIASRCGACRFIVPTLAELAKRLPSALFLKVDVDELKVQTSSYLLKVAEKGIVQSSA